MRKEKINVYLTQKQRDALKRLSARTGAPVAEIVRRAIDKVIK